MEMVALRMRRALYADTCCHMNAEGHAILGEAMGDAIALDLRAANLRP